MRFILALAALCFSCQSANAQASCAKDADLSQSLVLAKNDQRLFVEPDPKTRRVGDLFTLTVTLCDQNSQLTKVNAVMPSHGHGMNYRPSISKLEAGRFAAEGLLFHMPGLWELRIETTTGDKGEKFQAEFMIEP